MTDHLKSIRLQNWLCYKTQKFNFVPGVNMIIGPTDHGKSAMMDAILKVLENRPMGDRFQSWWGGKTSVSLKFEDVIVKYIKDSQALYQIKNTSSNKVIEFTAFKASVPEEITDILRMSRKINIQKQLEKKAPIFLLSESPGDVARHLNEVANLGGIDDALANAKTDLGADRAEKKQIEKVIKEKNKELATFYKLHLLKIMVAHAEKMEKRINDYQKQIDSMEDAIHQLTSVFKKIEKIDKKLRLAPLIRKALDLISEVEITEQERVVYSDELSELVYYQKRQVWIQNALKGKPAVNRGIALLQIIDQNIEEIDQWQGKLDSLKFGRIKARNIKKLIKTKQEEYRISFPDMCPLCHQPVKKEIL